jgi:magnesium chelatase family protein
VALAHNGVLFLDELPEFSREALEALREPLEAACVTIARSRGAVTFPTDVMLVAAMNPCPCGHFGNPQRACACVLPQIARYRARISGPLLDRIDLHVEVPSVPYSRLVERDLGEPSATVRARVAAAREIQHARFGDCPPRTNARMSAADLRCYASLDSPGQRLLAAASMRLGLSARGFTRIVKVARTIADLDQSSAIQPAHLAEAIQYRSLDRPLT